MNSRMIMGVLGLAVNRDGKYLLTLRNEPEHPHVHRKWQVPGGGMEYGEDALTTLRREMAEELTLPQFTLLFPYPMVYRQLYESSLENVQVNLLCYLITIGDQEPHIGDEETLEFGWFSVDEVLHLETLGGTADFVLEAEKIRTKYSLASE